MKNGLIKCKITVTYANKRFVMIKMIKVNMNYTAKLEIIATTPENLEVQLTIFVI